MYLLYDHINTELGHQGEVKFSIQAYDDKTIFNVPCMQLVKGRLKVALARLDLKLKRLANYGASSLGCCISSVVFSVLSLTVFFL